MEISDSPAYCWLLALLYGCFILNHTSTSKLKWRNPLEKNTCNISPLLRFYWWQTAYLKIDNSDFPSDTRKKRGHFVGIVEHV